VSEPPDAIVFTVASGEIAVAWYRVPMSTARWLLAPALLSLSACQSLAAGAKEQFSKDFSCPQNGIESRDRRDLHPSSFKNAMFLPKPSAEVAADPARLAVWQRNHQHDLTAGDENNDIEEARGCDNHAFYECHHPRKGTGVSCMQPPPPCTGCDRSNDPRTPEAPIPNGIPRW
jgi:hypothetical protein